MANLNSISKLDIMDAIRMALQKEFDSFQRASRQSRQDGNDEESKADSKYNTQSTEANYLADGQAKRAEEVVQAAAIYDSMEFRNFDHHDSIEVGALVELDIKNQSHWFFLGPAYGGLELYLDEKEITVITPESPLGAQLIGRHVGGEIDSPPSYIVSIS